ncbi:hypothetical protein [Streptomyces sp. NPDC047009]|uniref:hypothetical protein n=1 Tax=Streptomyces sp. NPDC047009 TaxID=3154496 RepID=UPI0033D22865
MAYYTPNVTAFLDSLTAGLTDAQKVAILTDALAHIWDGNSSEVRNGLRAAVLEAGA